MNKDNLALFLCALGLACPRPLRTPKHNRFLFTNLSSRGAILAMDSFFAHLVAVAVVVVVVVASNLVDEDSPEVDFVVGVVYLGL